MNILVVGGDRRMIYTVNELRRHGFSVDTLGLKEGDGGDIAAADGIILPVPVTLDGVDINCRLTGRKIPLDIIGRARAGVKIFGGGALSAENYTDYLSLDSYAVKNAVITAEGAICHAIENTDFSLWKACIMVIGYGRTGKILSERLKGFNPRLTVTARNGKDFSLLEVADIDYLDTRQIQNAKSRFDIVFNTVDIKLNYDVAAALSGSLFIDISTKGGFAGDAAAKNRIRYVKLPGIPGKSAPVTAGKIIAETVIELLK